MKGVRQLSVCVERSSESQPLLFSVRECWSLAWRLLSITFACEMSTTARQFEHSLALPFFGTGMKTDLFQSCGHWWVFQICWHTECGTFTASSFRIWNSSTGIPSPPLALFIMMLSKALLTSHYEISIRVLQRNTHARAHTHTHTHTGFWRWAS